MYRGDKFILWGVGPFPYSNILGRTSQKERPVPVSFLFCQKTESKEVLLYKILVL